MPEASPIPVEQQPLNEYQELCKSAFFCWPSLPLLTYLNRILRVWGLAWLIAGPLSAASFALPQAWGSFLATGVIGANFLLGLVLLRIYLGWIYVDQRLRSQEVVYEESGWYDGAVFVKSAEELAQHQLIVQYQIAPILQRLQYTFAGIIGISLIASLIWWL